MAHTKQHASALVLRIVRRDLLRLIRNPVRTFLLFSLPLSMAGLFALAFSRDTQEDIRIRVLLLDQDKSPLSKIIGGMSQDERLEVKNVGPEGYEMIATGQASALVHIPKGFFKAFLKGQTQAIKLIKNPSERFLPVIVEEGLHLGATVLSMASELFRPELNKLDAMMTHDESPSDLMITALSLGTTKKIRQLQKTINPPQIKLETHTLSSPQEKKKNELGILSFVLPGLAFMGILFLAQSATRDIIRDRESGLLGHLLTTPISAKDYLFGKCVSVMFLSVLGFGIFIVFGYLAGVGWGPPVAVMALVIGSSMAAGGSLVLLMSLTRTERQADSLSTIVIITWSMLGGAFLPVSQMPSIVQSIAMATPVYWTTTAFEHLIIHDGSFADILTPIGVLVGIGLVGTLLGVVALDRSISAGSGR
jgi:ABC-2 type transport system permease protein